MKLQRSVTKIVALFLMALIISGCGGAEGRKAKYMERGKVYLEQENYDKARVEFRNVLQIDPKHAEAYYLLGLTEEARQNWQQAFGSYSKAVELNPDYIDARAKLGLFFLYRRGRSPHHGRHRYRRGRADAELLLQLFYQLRKLQDAYLLQILNYVLLGNLGFHCFRGTVNQVLGLLEAEAG